MMVQSALSPASLNRARNRVRRESKCVYILIKYQSVGLIVLVLVAGCMQ